MSKYTAGKFSKSLYYALRGLRVAFKSQRNFRTQIFVGSIAIILALFLGFSTIELCILLFVIAMVLICELFNSVIEFVLDATYRNKYSKLVEMSKDMSAGAVLLATFFSLFLGLLLFANKILILFNLRAILWH
ncbi:MAG: diacylglycerol kinase family protein [Candidatus Gastranaerophilales bacterium]|nr:diacylglycerol kinase family protein [Candidatus Gastranaerophilales bacterium]